MGGFWWPTSGRNDDYEVKNIILVENSDKSSSNGKGNFLWEEENDFQENSTDMDYVKRIIIYWRLVRWNYDEKFSESSNSYRKFREDRIILRTFFLRAEMSTSYIVPSNAEIKIYVLGMKCSGKPFFITHLFTCHLISIPSRLVHQEGKIN